jgi:hypothetical protein
MTTNQNGQKSGMVNGNSGGVLHDGQAAGMPDIQEKSVLACILDRLRDLSPTQLTTGTSIPDQREKNMGYVVQYLYFQLYEVAD